MRLVVTVERYAPAIGGAERVAQRVAEGMSARGHEVDVVTSGPRGQDEIGGVTVHRFPVSGNDARGIAGDVEPALELIRSLAPDLVFNYAAQTWTTDSSRVLFELPDRPRMVLAPCGFSGLGTRRYRAYYDDMPARLRSYDALVFHSSIYRDWDFALRAGAEPRFVVPNGADPPADGAAVRATVDGRPLAVTVGSHVFSKGHRDFARAVHRIARDRPLTGMILAPPRHGLDGLRGCQAECRARARLRPRELRVVDGSGPGAVAEAVAAADLFLFASRIECAPLVILEAMAAGTPWVSYDVGNVAELGGGLVVDGFEELVSAGRSVLDSEHPTLGDEGRAAWDAGHRWEDVLARYEQVFDEVLREPVAA
jgi:glycosyltransferase involved in cell wall biosynthesis